jgi:hypothetical protein
MPPAALGVLQDRLGSSASGLLPLVQAYPAAPPVHSIVTSSMHPAGGGPPLLLLALPPLEAVSHALAQ